MAGYIIAQVEVTDPDRFKTYVDKVLPTIQAFGGEYILRSGEMAVLEGEWPMPFFVVLKFPNIEKAKAWYDSDAYKPLLELRKSASNSNLIVTEDR